jgi:hypothetical protein
MALANAVKVKAMEGVAGALSSLALASNVLCPIEIFLMSLFARYTMKDRIEARL